MRKMNEETKQKIGFKNRGRVVSQEVKDAIAKSKSKRVRRLNDGAIFPSILAAARASGLSYTSVSSICNKKAEVIRGMRFEFVDE